MTEIARSGRAMSFSGRDIIPSVATTIAIGTRNENNNTINDDVGQGCHDVSSPTQSPAQSRPSSSHSSVAMERLSFDERGRTVSSTTTPQPEQQQQSPRQGQQRNGGSRSQRHQASYSTPDLSMLGVNRGNDQDLMSNTWRPKPHPLLRIPMISSTVEVINSHRSETSSRFRRRGSSVRPDGPQQQQRSGVSGGEQRTEGRSPAQRHRPSFSAPNFLNSDPNTRQGSNFIPSRRRRTPRPEATSTTVATINGESRSESRARSSSTSVAQKLLSSPRLSLSSIRSSFRSHFRQLVPSSSRSDDFNPPSNSPVPVNSTDNSNPNPTSDSNHEEIDPVRRAREEARRRRREERREERRRRREMMRLYGTRGEGIGEGGRRLDGGEEGEEDWVWSEEEEGQQQEELVEEIQVENVENGRGRRRIELLPAYQVDKGLPRYRDIDFDAPADVNSPHTSSANLPPASSPSRLRSSTNPLRPCNELLRPPSNPEESRDPPRLETDPIRSTSVLSLGDYERSTRDPGLGSDEGTMTRDDLTPSPAARDVPTPATPDPTLLSPGPRRRDRRSYSLNTITRLSVHVDGAILRAIPMPNEPPPNYRNRLSTSNPPPTTLEISERALDESTAPAQPSILLPQEDDQPENENVRTSRETDRFSQFAQPMEQNEVGRPSSSSSSSTNYHSGGFSPRSSRSPSTPISISTSGSPATTVASHSNHLEPKPVELTSMEQPLIGVGIEGAF